MWKCVCDCGNITVIASSHLKSGHTQSCGCFNKEIITTHGMSKTRIYRIWRKMKERCYNPNHIYYDHYGGRGIYICEEWLTDFVNFEKWAIKSGYNDNLSIDRIDTNGCYCPINCRWADDIEQNNNKRNNVMYTYKNATMTMAQFARKYNIYYGTLQKRLHGGMDIITAIEKPIRKGR